MTNHPVAWAFVAFLPCLAATGLMVAVESRHRTTTVPSLAEWRRACGAAVRRFRESLDDERPRGPWAWVRELAWVPFGPALAVRAMMHVGAAVAIVGGDPGELDLRRVVTSPVVDLSSTQELQVRVATACFGGFWLMNAGRNMDPLGLWYFGVQLAVLIIDPAAWAGLRVLSQLRSDS